MRSSPRCSYSSGSNSTVRGVTFIHEMSPLSRCSH
jgi:hypothetical protein